MIMNSTFCLQNGFLSQLKFFWILSNCLHKLEKNVRQRFVEELSLLRVEWGEDREVGMVKAEWVEVMLTYIMSS